MTDEKADPFVEIAKRIIDYTGSEANAARALKMSRYKLHTLTDRRRVTIEAARKILNYYRKNKISMGFNNG